MVDFKISVSEPFVSPSWGSDIVVFSNSSGEAITEEKSKEYLAKACRYAAKYKIHLIPERFTVLGIEALCIIDTQGKVVTAQQQIFNDHNTGVKNTNLNVASTEHGNIALCVGKDIYHPEFGRIAYNKGVKIIVSSQQLPTLENNNHNIISGVWGIAQNNNLYVVGVSNQSNCVCAPRLLTKNQEGFLIAPTIKSFTVVIAISKLKDLKPRTFLPRQFYFMHREQLIGEAEIKD